MTCSIFLKISSLLTLLALLVGCGGGSSYGGGPTGAVVPGVPVSVSATAGDGQVTLSWAATTYATSYPVKRSATSGSAGETIASPGSEIAALT